MTSTDPAILDRSAVAALLGVQPATITRYVNASKPGGKYASAPFPKADGIQSGRWPWWRVARADEIRAWGAARPGRGVGGGRPSHRGHRAPEA